ncbi:MAG: hypothetical protein JWQ70_2132 [Aeromicrobium sp.]|jgi:hypothetical protein|nr:hypothetical protein [Aeromicrobium sp.]
MTTVIALTLGWSGLVLELGVLTWLVARRNR